MALKKVVGIAVFSALAFVVALVCNVIPPVQGFLSLDVKDAIITVAAFAYGPVSAVMISLISAAVEWVTISTTGWYGFVMNFVSSATFSLVATLIYTRKRNINGALIALFAAVIATTGAMLLMNNFVTPFFLTYRGWAPNHEAARATVEGLLPKVLLPFNFAKTMLNGATLMMIYKPVTIAMSRVGMIEKKNASQSHNKNASATNEKNLSLTFNKNSAIILATGTICLVVALTIYFIIA